MSAIHHHHLPPPAATMADRCHAANEWLYELYTIEVERTLIDAFATMPDWCRGWPSIYSFLKLQIPYYYVERLNRECVYQAYKNATRGVPLPAEEMRVSRRFWGDVLVSMSGIDMHPDEAAQVASLADKVYEVTKEKLRDLLHPSYGPWKAIFDLEGRSGEQEEDEEKHGKRQEDLRRGEEREQLLYMLIYRVREVLASVSCLLKEDKLADAPDKDQLDWAAHFDNDNGTNDEAVDDNTAAVPLPVHANDRSTAMDLDAVGTSTSHPAHSRGHTADAGSDSIRRDSSHVPLGTHQPTMHRAQSRVKHQSQQRPSVKTEQDVPRQSLPDQYRLQHSERFNAHREQDATEVLFMLEYLAGPTATRSTEEDWLFANCSLSDLQKRIEQGMAPAARCFLECHRNGRRMNVGEAQELSAMVPNIQIRSVSMMAFQHSLAVLRRRNAVGQDDGIHAGSIFRTNDPNESLIRLTSGNSGAGEVQEAVLGKDGLAGEGNTPYLLMLWSVPEDWEHQDFFQQARSGNNGRPKNLFKAFQRLATRILHYLIMAHQCPESGMTDIYYPLAKGIADLSPTAKEPSTPAPEPSVEVSSPHDETHTRLLDDPIVRGKILNKLPVLTRLCYLPNGIPVKVSRYGPGGNYIRSTFTLDRNVQISMPLDRYRQYGFNRTLTDIAVRLELDKNASYSEDGRLTGLQILIRPDDTSQWVQYQFPNSRNGSAPKLHDYLVEHELS